MTDDDGKPRTPATLLRLSPEQRATLDELHRRTGRSRAEILRTALDRYAVELRTGRRKDDT